VPPTLNINTTAPLAGGGNLTTDRTLSLNLNGVTNAFLAQMPTLTIKGNNTGGAANALDLTTGQVKTMLAISLTSDVTGTLQAAQMPTLAGDVTTPGGSLTTTIAANAVTNGKLAQMPTLTIKGNNTGGTANALDLTVTQVQSMLSVPTGANPSVNSGLTAVNGSANTFLRSDGAPALSQAISPTWSGAHIFQQDVTLSGNRTLILKTTAGVAAGAIEFQNSAGTVKSGIASFFNVADEGNLEFLGLGAVTHMQISSGGNVIISAPASGQTLKVAPSPAAGELMSTSAALTDGAGAAAGTLLTAPSAGNPTKWIKINDNGTVRSIPAW
jgi:hypothetical protein